MKRHCQHVVLSLLMLALGLAVADANEDKRPLEHEDYDRWNTIRGTAISQDGHWAMYSVLDGKDKGTLYIRSLTSRQQYKVKNANRPTLSADSKHVAYRITVDKDLIKILKKEDKPKSEWPQEKFEFLNLETGARTTMTGVKSFSMPRENGDWIAMLLEAPKDQAGAEQGKAEESEKFEVTPEGLARSKKKSEKKKPSKNKKPKAEAVSKGEEKKGEEKSAKATAGGSEKDAKKKGEKKKEKQAGTTLVLKHLSTGMETRYPNVVSFRFDKAGENLAFVTSVKDDGDGDGVWWVELDSRKAEQVAKGLGNYRNLVFSDDGRRLAFVTDRDDYQSKDPSWGLFTCRSGQQKAQLVAKEGNESLPPEWWVSSTSSPFFTENGKYLAFYTAPKPEDANAEEESDVEPKAKLDLWHWQDPQLQPQQLLQAQAERNRSYIATYNLRTRKIAQLATKQIPDVVIDARRDSDSTLGISDEKYRKTISWDMPGFRDVYLMNLRTGKSELILERIRNRPQLSPDGKFAVWWDTDTRNWYAVATKPGAELVNLTQSIEFPFWNQLHDTPSDPRPYGIAGWIKGDKAVVVYDRYDLWQLDPAGQQAPICLTQSQGRENTIRFRNQRLDRETRHIDPNDLFLTAFNEYSKESGYYRFSQVANQKEPKNDESDGQSPQPKNPLTKIIMLPESLGGFQKAEDSDRVLFTRSTFRRFPDIWASDMQFKTIERISNANPQQRDYVWGTAELTSWKADDGQELQGLLYKPDDFDSSKKYPLMVYFYERNSDNLHKHYVPAAGRSIINFSFYVSRGYVIFVPDIPYKTGEPGPSAAAAVLPGVQHVVDQGFIDEKRIGTQGHSWGGYQTAYLVTQTDIFACAESGAPVSNMTSAYGGIRWGSGMSRMFQYERTQSRIGGTLWDSREKYIANSPLFFVDKINTPLLILHNDEDGAVPWYQGIELFVAMRRLEKPAWLLNYNGDPHWVMGRENRLDFAKRMQQFFDHYLMDGPLPKWMAKGIPAVDKGKDFGFEEVESETQEVEPESSELKAESEEIKS